MAKESVAVTPESLRAVRKALREVEVGLTKELNVALRERVARPLAVEIAGSVPKTGTGWQHKAPGRWARSIAPGGTAKGAWVTWGRKSVPYAGWLEFGGDAGHYGHDRKLNGPRRLPRAPKGRYVFPKVEANRLRANSVARQVVHEISKRAGLA